MTIKLGDTKAEATLGDQRGKMVKSLDSCSIDVNYGIDLTCIFYFIFSIIITCNYREEIT